MSEDWLVDLLRDTDPGPSRPHEEQEEMAAEKLAHTPDQERVPSLPPRLHEVGGYPGDGAEPTPTASHPNPRIVTAEEFGAVEEPGTLAVLGDDENALLAADGEAMFYGDGGAGKTTLVVDFSAHAAAGDDWLGISIARPLIVLLIENEGPRKLFRAKVRRKIAGWKGSPLGGRLLVWEEPWSEFTFADPQWRQLLADRIAQLQIDVVVIGPITAAGMDEAGTIQEARAFQKLVHNVRVRACREDVLFVLVHHESKGGRVSGAWEGVGDTLIHVQAQGHGRTRVHIQKARWASEYHQTSMNLTWAEGEGFDVQEDAPEVDDETLGELMMNAVRENPGDSWSAAAKRVRAAVKERQEKGISNDRLQRIRDGLFAGRQLLNVIAQGSVEVGLWECPERKKSRLHDADDPVVKHLRPERGAAAAQFDPPEGGTW